MGFRKNDVIPYIMSSKSYFFDENHRKYKDVKLETDSDTIRKILFVLDADDINKDAVYGGYLNTKDKLDNVITNLGIKNISQVYVMRDPITQSGNLESLILSTIEQQLRNCIECFLDCSQLESKENHKAILNQIYHIAYPNEPYNFKHPHFDDLKTQLTQLFAESE
jgi:hypothetical protein